MRERIKWIDVAKGICMVSIVLGHQGIGAIDKYVYAYHLTLFFILSGYTMKQVEVNRDYLEKKFIRLMLPYFATCFIIIILDIFNCFFLIHDTSNQTVTNVIAKDLIRSFWASGSITAFGNVEIGSRIGAIWFLPAFFWAVIGTQAVIRYVSSKKMQCAIVGTGAVLSMVLARFIWLPFSIQSGLMAMPYILLGYFIKDKKLLERVNFKIFILCLTIYLLGVWGNLSVISFVSANAPDYVISFLIALASSICVIYISNKIGGCKVLEWIGQNSLYFMCVHLVEAEQMGTWRWMLLDKMGIYNTFTSIVLQLLLVCLITFLITEGKKVSARFRERQATKVLETKRDAALDASKGALIVLMVMGHFVVDSGFSKILYSFHMAAFIFYSGYCFKEGACADIKTSILKLIKSFLIPYGCFAVLYCLVTNDGIGIELKNVLCGLSFSNKIFNQYSSVGPVYFVLLLFLVRLIYLFVAKYIHTDMIRNGIVILLSMGGYLLGQRGWWLPWSADVALYSLIFYHIGFYFKKYNIMEYVCSRRYLYFVLSCVWAYAIYMGGMEIAVRYYGNYSLVILGAVCGSTLFYMFFREISDMGRGIAKLLQQVGKSTIYILIIHTLFHWHVYMWVAHIWQEGYFPHLLITVIIQVFAGVVIAMIVRKILMLPKSLQRT